MPTNLLTPGARRGRRGLIVLAAAAAVALAGCNNQNSSNNPTPAPKPGGGAPAATAGGLNGAGSSFVNPAMSQWTYQYHADHPDVTINYQSVGSGAGIGLYKQGSVDFGATDAPLSDKDLAGMPTPTVHIPLVAGATVMAYNLPDVTTPLKLTGTIIANIYLGKITKWNDAKIAAANPGVKLPDMTINVAHRSDGSGTTYVFTDYLSTVSPDWKAGPGKGKTVNWPAGVGGKGSEGVAGLIRQTPGTIGYVELAYALQAKMAFAQVQNAAGKWVTASGDTTAAAAAAHIADLKKDIRTSIVNAPGAESYPICGFTYALVSKQPKDAARAKQLGDFLRWCVGPGQAMSAKLQYAPLPDPLVKLDTATLDSIGK